MKTNPDAPRSPSIRLTEGIFKKLGLTCIWLDRIGTAENTTRLVLRTIAGRRAVGEKIWFRSHREADRVYQACLSRCFEASRRRDGIIVKLPYDEVVGLIELVASSLGLAAIKDADVAVTFDSLNRRIEAVIARMQRDGSMKKLNREYSTLRLATDGSNGGTKSGTNGGTIGTSLPPYADWLVGRLESELSRCTDLVHITRL